MRITLLAVFYDIWGVVSQDYGGGVLVRKVGCHLIRVSGILMKI